MAKFGVGVGEEFPVDEPAKSETPNSKGSGRCGWRGHHRNHRFGWLHFGLHVVFRLAIIGLVIAAAVSLFEPHHFADSPHGYPYHHHMLFFPFLLIGLLLLFAFRRHHHHWHRHWHDEPRGPDGEGA